MSGAFVDSVQAKRRSLPLVSPSFCQYVAEECDQTFEAAGAKVFFVYGSGPEVIASTISDTVAHLNRVEPTVEWLSWEAMEPRGNAIFCKICGSMRAADVVVADITTLNFNVMFEIGFAIGLGVPVIPIKDPTIAADQRKQTDTGLLDTIGTLEFTNPADLASALLNGPRPEPLPDLPTREYREQPIYLIKAPIAVSGSLALASAIKKARLKYRSFDVVETPRLSLHEARRQVAGSFGVVADLLDPSREGATSHNARCALICGMAMAQQKAVLMLQEEIKPTTQPIDYRDVVKPYRSHVNVAGLTREFLSTVVDLLQNDSGTDVGHGINRLALIDLGDVAAENEIVGLQHYYVQTGPSVQAQQGHARLVIGRKGAGKTAIFYGVRSAVRRGHDRLVIDLKPEGHQFVELKEALLDKLGPGLQEHIMVAFWHYILLAEVARYALERDRQTARLNPLTAQRYDRLEQVYSRHNPGEELDFSQRLLQQVDRLTRRLGNVPIDEIGPKITEVIYAGDYRELNASVNDYLRTKDAIWLLVDNLDKGWPIRSAGASDILIVRSLLEATRKLQREFGNQQLDFHCLVFLRSDIYELLVAATPDKGKDTAIRLDWDDPSVFEKIVGRRLDAEADQPSSDFNAAWSRICEPLVGGQSSFDYIVDRTLMRPRDVLKFVRHAVAVALNRGHERILEEDVCEAERIYSQDMLAETAFEIVDTHPELQDVLYAFEGSPAETTPAEATDRLVNLVGLDIEAARSALELLLWFGFLGVRSSPQAEVRYGYQVQGNLRRLTFALESGDATVVIHPGFRSALQTVEDWEA